MKNLINILLVVVVLTVAFVYEFPVIFFALISTMILGYLVIVNERLKLITKHLNIDEKSIWKTGFETTVDEDEQT
ncbi:hypothetical protein ACLIA0_07730 [Bacillaceae bacterium W0354]